MTSHYGTPETKKSPQHLEATKDITAAEEHYHITNTHCAIDCTASVSHLSQLSQNNRVTPENYWYCHNPHGLSPHYAGPWFDFRNDESFVRWIERETCSSLSQATSSTSPSTTSSDHKPEGSNNYQCGGGSGSPLAWGLYIHNGFRIVYAHIGVLLKKSLAQNQSQNPNLAGRVGASRNRSWDSETTRGMIKFLTIDILSHPAATPSSAVAAVPQRSERSERRSSEQSEQQGAWICHNPDGMVNHSAGPWYFDRQPSCPECNHQPCKVCKLPSGYHDRFNDSMTENDIFSMIYDW
ncbi:hypothetical protein BZA05DRAFT_416131 [Tricharina praecox]|uniref:uncharacterized protein n=1 Tax=Tricharina praecox TaxID=43433 RepID=UPI00221F59D3|nr:uncharacterized protein BZA05DRAFT_416131 [Tricharina praecox]KAI5856450.1 hypothetical protein BZA05DRAFT_416131 [Tricharina praecox]